MRTLAQVIEKVCPIIREQITQGFRAPLIDEDAERLKKLFDLMEDVYALGYKKLDFSADRVCLNLYEAVGVSDEDYERIMKRLLELSR